MPWMDSRRALRRPATQPPTPIAGAARFRVVSERLYEVTEGFPKLSAASFNDGLPTGIERVEYDITLDTCSAFLRGN